MALFKIFLPIFSHKTTYPPKTIQWWFRFSATTGSHVCRNYSNRNVLKLNERGMYQDLFPDSASNEIVDLLNAEPQCVYAGFDPTANSLHVGNLLVLMNLLHWHRAGHKVIALVGGATGQIGDPSGKSAERQQLSSSLVESNTSAIKQNIEQIFSNHKNYVWKKTSDRRPAKIFPIEIVNNLEWYDSQNMVEFIGRVGRHFRMGTMLSRHSVQTRLNSESGLSFTEFCYQVFQAYDWLHLFKTRGCRFQIGGSDQMGNITSGHDLISREADEKVYGLTLPLVTSESGNKFGKSAGNAVWLAEDKTSSFELYQFFIRSKDSDVEKLLKLFTFQSLGKISDIMFKHNAKPEARFAQTRLAEEVTLLVHGVEGLKSAQHASAALYGKDIESLSQMSVRDVCTVFQGASSCNLLLNPGTTVLDAALKAGCFENQGDATKIITAGGFYINHQRITNIAEVLTPAVHILPNNISLLRVGDKKGLQDLSRMMAKPFSVSL